MATSVDPQYSTQPVNPTMVYQATSPQSPEAGHSTQRPPNIRFQPPANSPPCSHNGHDAQKPIKFRFHAAAAVRLVIIPFALTGIVLSCTVGIHAMLVLATIVQFTCIGWNLLVLVAVVGSSNRSLPKFLCQIGGCVCRCGGDSDDDEARPAGMLDEPTEPPRRTFWLKYYWLVDIVLPTLLLMFTCFAAASIDYSWYWAWPPRRMQETFAMAWVVV